MLYSLAPLKQTLLDLVTYCFYNRGTYDLPQNVRTGNEQSDRANPEQAGVPERGAARPLGSRGRDGDRGWWVYWH